MMHGKVFNMDFETVKTYPIFSELKSHTIREPMESIRKQREQLMWDIDGIVDEFASNNNITEDDMEDLIKVLCDAVCKNFPLPY